MKLIVFHKVLIGSAILFCFAYGLYELYLYWFPGPDSETGGPALWTGLSMIAGGILLSIYLAWVFRQSGRARP